MNGFVDLKNIHVRMELRAFVLRDLEQYVKDCYGTFHHYYGDLREYDIETAVLDQMLGQKLRYSAVYSGMPERLRQASNLLIHVGYYRVTTLRAFQKQHGAFTLRELFGPRAATAAGLKLFEDVPEFGDWEGISARIERNFPEALRAYAAHLLGEEKKKILALIGDNHQEAEKVKDMQEANIDEKAINDWCAQARLIADEFFDADTKNNSRDSLEGYSIRVMDEMQKRGIKGPRGIIDNSNTVKRDALQSDKWWRNKKK